jgi:hypothetical protein
MPLEAVVTGVIPTEGKAPAEEQTVQRRLDPALFIDNMVIAFGYVWMCFGLLAIVAAALGGVFLWRRRNRLPAQPVPDPGPPPAAQQSPPAPPPSPPTRVAARRSSPPPQDLD